MKKEVILVPEVKTPESPFNHVVKAGEFLFLTSQLSCNLKTGELYTSPIAEQTKNALENVRFLLESSGSSMDNILKAVVYMRDVGDFEKMDQVYRTFFSKGNEPARVTVQSPSPITGIDIEIEVIALASS